MVQCPHRGRGLVEIDAREAGPAHRGVARAAAPSAPPPAEPAARSPPPRAASACAPARRARPMSDRPRAWPAPLRPPPPGTGPARAASERRRPAPPAATGPAPGEVTELCQRHPAERDARGVLPHAHPFERCQRMAGRQRASGRCNRGINRRHRLTIQDSGTGLTHICPMRHIRHMESAFAVIAEPNRRAILSLLASSERSVGDIEELRMPQPSVSKHLRVLREAGLRGVARRCAAASLPYQARATDGDRRLAGSVPPLLVGARRRSRTAPRPHGASPRLHGKGKKR